jgi:hypothetical protein
MAPVPVPAAVVASNTVVGAGGTITFDGTCTADGGAPIGPVVVSITGETTATVDTGVTTSPWSYTWTAPVDGRDASTFVFRFWCGDPRGHGSVYPVELERTVDMVASAPPVAPDGSPPTVTAVLPPTT